MNLKFQSRFGRDQILNIKSDLIGFEFQIKKLETCLQTGKIGNKNLEIGKSKRGFTLIEMLIYMGMLSIFLGVLSAIFGSILETQLESEATSSVEQDSRYIFSRLSYDIKRADTILVPASLGDETNSLQIIINGISYTYALNNGNFEITDNLDTSRINGFDTTIASLNFQRLGNDPMKENTIRITFTITSKTIRASGPESRSFNTTIGTR